MNRQYLFVALFAFIIFNACKKDQLHFANVQKIESFSDSDRLGKVIFTDAQNGYIVGGKWYIESIVLTTKNGGDTWQRNQNPNVGHLLNSADIGLDGTIYGVGFEGKLVHSYDSGKTWIFHQLEHYWFRDIAFTAPDKAIIVGGISFGSGMIQYIDTAGNLLKRDSLKYQLNQIKMVTPQVGYICGFGTVLKTTNGGTTWDILNVKGDNFMTMDIHGDTIWMCGNNGGIYQTTDAGANWKTLRNGNDITGRSYKLMDIAFKDKLNGWAVGENGIVIYSDDGGNHWMEYTNFTNNLLTSIAICADGRLIAVGDNGSIYKLTR